MPDIKLNGKMHVKTARQLIEGELDMAVDLLDAASDPARDDMTISSLSGGKHSTAPFSVPSFKAHVGTLEEKFFEHFAFRINVLLPSGNEADDGATLATIRRIHARSRTDLPPLASWLNEVLDRKGLDVDTVAEKSGVAVQTIKNIRIGKTQNPQDATVERIQEAVGEEVPPGIADEIEQEATIAGVGELVDFDPHVPDDIPNGPGIYVFYDISERPVYVGKSESSVRSRVTSGHSGMKYFIKPIVERAAYVQINDRALLAKIERLLIRFLKSNAVLNTQYVDRSGITR